MNLFLEKITPKESCKSMMNNLMNLISDQELKDTVGIVKRNRRPGPDGLGIEFYQTMFPIIKNDLKDNYNGYLQNGRMLAETKSSITTLTPKPGPENLIENYRPISLLNCDYKIFSKIISQRLQPILKEIIHESQYAQPGRDINDMNTLTRDLLHDMDISMTDSFFISVDFSKAFDSVCHKFLYQILERYGFPINFINLIKEMFRDAGTHILINGYKSKKIKIKAGSRQGDPLSRDVFVMAINPLLIFLSEHNLIRKYETISRKQFLMLAYMDDVNFATQSLSSVINTLFYIKKYEKASGLGLNTQKTKGMFFNKTNIFNVLQLPNITWEEKITILKINHGPGSWVRIQWEGLLEKFERWLKYYKTFAVTMKAKANVSKNKLLSMMTYAGTTYPLPTDVKNAIDKLIIKFIVPFFSVQNHNSAEIEDKISNFAAPISLDGIGIDHITLHTDLFCSSIY